MARAWVASVSVIHPTAQLQRPPWPPAIRVPIKIAHSITLLLPRGSKVSSIITGTKDVTRAVHASLAAPPQSHAANYRSSTLC